MCVWDLQGIALKLERQLCALQMERPSSGSHDNTTSAGIGNTNMLLVAAAGAFLSRATAVPSHVPLSC